MLQLFLQLSHLGLQRGDGGLELGLDLVLHLLELGLQLLVLPLHLLAGALVLLGGAALRLQLIGQLVHLGGGGGDIKRVEGGWAIINEI